MNFVIDFLVPFGPLLRKAGHKPPFFGLGPLLLHAIPLSFFIFWLFSFIPYVGGLVYFLIFVPLAARLYRNDWSQLSGAKKREITLWYLVVIVIGFGGLWNFIGHTFLADSIAQGIGWQTGSPFQTELAFYHLGFAVAALTTIWLRGKAIMALVIAKSIFWYGAAGVHLHSAIINTNYSSMNIGGPLFADIVLPTLLLVLLFWPFQGKSLWRSLSQE